MGTFSVELQVGDPSGTRFETIEALVDTGSTYTVLPGSVLRRLGVEPHRTSTFALADGRRLEMAMGRTVVKLGDQTEVTLVIFGDDDVSPLLGAVTLEEFLLAPDPVHQRLTPTTALWMRH